MPIDGAASKTTFNSSEYFDPSTLMELTEGQSESEKVQLADGTFAYPTHRGLVYYVM